jgi:NRAMP (natural resistance-associated macrophage protein)-like metal ion transporter
MAKISGKARKFFKIMGPGFITGAADDDPSGIATYTQTGAQFGYGQLWTALAMLPFMVAIQEACARIGAVTGKGLARVIKDNYSKKVLYLAVSFILIANVINIGADIGAMAAAIELLVPVRNAIIVLLIAALILVLEIFLSYRTYSRVLKWLAISLLAYPLTVFLVKQPWLEILKATFVPHIEPSFGFLFLITGVFGTTISPYMFFWEASQEVEEEEALGLVGDGGCPNLSRSFLRHLRLDNFVGMLSSEIATWCIIVVAATVLNRNGVTDIRTAADAARALEPLVRTFPHAGEIAKLVFATGVVGLGLLGVPVLSSSASYALSEALNWKEGLNLKFKQAHGFYGIIIASIFIGLAIDIFEVNPIKALVFAAVFNGLAAVPLIFIISKVARSKIIMGDYRSGNLSHVLVRMTFAVMAISAVLLFVTMFTKR